MPCMRRENVRHATLLFCVEGVWPWWKNGAGERKQRLPMANNEYIGEFNALDVEYGAKLADPLIDRIKELVTKMRQILKSVDTHGHVVS